MALKNIFKLFLIAIFVMGILNFAYANGGPIVGENQAKQSAQNYLNSNNLPYTAIIPNWDDLQVKVKNTKTGEIKWIPTSKYDSEENSHSNGYSEPKYKLIDYYPTWIVQINDNRENVGQIYVDANDAEVLKVIIHGKVLKNIINQKHDVDPSAPDTRDANNAAINDTNDTNITNQTIPVSTNQSGSADNTGIILATAIIAITLGIGYFMYSRV